MFDTIVLGNDPASLIAAITLANQKRKTLLLLEDDLPECFSESGYTFDIDPLPWTGMGRNGIFRQVLSRLGIPHEDHDIHPALQVIFRDHRIDLCGIAEADRREIEREFSGDSPKLVDFYGTIEKSASFTSGLIDKNLHLQPETIPDYLRLLRHMPAIVLNKKSFTKSLDNIRENPRLATLLEAQILLTSNLDPSEISPISFARMLYSSLYGFSYHTGGKSLLIDKLRKRFEADGGEIERCSLSSLDIERVIKINAKNDGAEMPTIYGKNAIISTRYGKLGVLIEENSPFASIRGKYRDTAPSLWPFTIHIGVHEKCIPEMMGTYVVVSDETKTPGRGDLLFLEMSDPGDTLRAPDGKRAISATIFLKNPPLKFSDDSLKKTSDSMMNTLESLLPFLKENLDFFNPDASIATARTCATLASHKYRMKNPLIGISFMSAGTPVKNVFLTGDKLMPGLGFEGEIMSGMIAARHVMEEE